MKRDELAKEFGIVFEVEQSELTYDYCYCYETAWKDRPFYKGKGTRAIINKCMEENGWKEITYKEGDPIFNKNRKYVKYERK